MSGYIVKDIRIIFKGGISMYKDQIPILLVNITNMRVASGQSVANVTDIPLMRDLFNNIIIPSTSLKGALRSKVYLTTGNKALVDFLFGTAEVAEEKIMPHMGLVAVYDAHLVFIPVSSTVGVIYLTSPSRLNRFMSYLGVKSEVVSVLVNSLYANSLSDNIVMDPNMAREVKKINIVGGVTLKVFHLELVGVIRKLLTDSLGELWRDIEQILGGVKIGVVSDEIFDVVLEKAITIRPGIKIKGFEKEDSKGEYLDVYEKVVSKQGPRFEEEIHALSIFISKIAITRTKIPLKYVLVDDSGEKNMRSLLGDLTTVCDKIIIEFKGEKCLMIDTECIKRIFSKYAGALFLGGKETLSRGLVALLYPKIKPPELAGKYETKKASTPLVRSYPSIVELLDAIKNTLLIEEESVSLSELVEEIREKSSILKGKFSGLPERFRLLDTVSVMLFYDILKSTASGVGYSEVRNTIKWITMHYIDPKEVVGDDGYIRDDKISQYLMNLSFIIDLLTKLKYIVRSYGD